MDIKQIVKEFYNADAEIEWERIGGRPEFLLTCRFLDRYIKSGDKILDIGGGPGRYSIYLAQKGCDVTLFDLAQENLNVAKKHALENEVNFDTICGDACIVDELIDGEFDNILLMGPLYHLLDEQDRIKSVNAALKLLKPGGVLFVSFISLISGMIYAMKFEPAIICEQAETEFYNTVIENKSFAGEAFTQAYFIAQNKVLPFMNQFGLEKLHLFGQEGILSPCEDKIMNSPKEVVDKWLELSETLCERDELLSWSEHLMYIGRKI